MPTQYHFDLLLHETVDGALRSRHGDIEYLIVSGREMMVSDDDTRHVFRHRRESLLAMAELAGIDATVGDTVPWRGGIETHQYHVTDLQHRIEIRRDDFEIERMGFEQALEDPPQRHVVVTGNQQRRQVWHTVEKLPGLLELVTLGALGNIAAHHDGIGIEGRNHLQQILRHCGLWDRPASRAPPVRDEPEQLALELEYVDTDEFLMAL